MEHEDKSVSLSEFEGTTVPPAESTTLAAFDNIEGATAQFNGIKDVMGKVSEIDDKDNLEQEIETEETTNSDDSPSSSSSDNSNDIIFLGCM